MKAVILAGGKGTRLAPYTTTFPKPLVPIGNKPILEIIIRQLAHYGFTDVVLNVGYMSELIEAYFQTAKGALDGVSIAYTREDEPTGTAGSLASVSGLDETFLVMNGDVLSSVDYRSLVAFHREHDAALTIAMHRRQVNVDFGILDVPDGLRITGYDEKPEIDYNVSMGIYIYEPRVLDFIEPGTYLDFPDLVKRLLENGETVVGCPSDCEWLDIGRHEDYERAQLEFQEKRSLYLPGE